MSTPPPPPQGPPPGGYPPPSGGGYGPPGPGGPGGPPSPYNGPGKPGFDPKTVNPLDWAIVGIGVLTFLFSFIAYYSGVTAEANGREASFDGSFSAWNDIIGGGFFNWFAMVLAVVGAALVAAQLFAPGFRNPLPFSNRVAGLGAFAIALLFIILGIFVTPSDSYGGILADSDVDYSADHGFGYFVSFILIIAGTVLSLMRIQATGEQLPGGLGGKVPNIGHHGPQGGITGSQGQPGQFGHPQPGQGQYGQQQPGQYGQQPPPPQSGNPPPPPGYGPPQ